MTGIGRRRACFYEIIFCDLPHPETFGQTCPRTFEVVYWIPGSRTWLGNMVKRFMFNNDWTMSVSSSLYRSNNVQDCRTVFIHPFFSSVVIINFIATEAVFKYLHLLPAHIIICPHLVSSFFSANISYHHKDSSSTSYLNGNRCLLFR